MADERFKTVGDFNTQFNNCSGFTKYTKKNSEYFVINEELSEMFLLSGAENVDLTGYDNKKFTTSFPAWRSKTPTGGYISFGITLYKQHGHDFIFDEVSVYCTENKHKDYLHSQSNNYLFKYVYIVDKEDNKESLLEFGCIESVEKDYRIDISDVACSASGFWFNNGFNSIFGESLSPDICKKTGTSYRHTKKGFIIKDDKPLTLLCNEGYGCTL